MAVFGTSARMLESGDQEWHAPRRAVSSAAMRVLGKVVYWLAVLLLSIVLLVVLVRFFESRDSSQIDEESRAPRDVAGAVWPGRV